MTQQTDTRPEVEQGPPAFRFSPSQLPPPRDILAWVYGGRILITAGIVILALVGGRVRIDVLPGVLTLVAVLLLTGFSAGYTHLRDRKPGRPFLYAQVVLDALLVTWILHAAGGQVSTLAPLYLLVICAAALLLPFLGGLLVGGLTIVLYLGVSIGSAEIALTLEILLQVLLFATVALVTGLLGDRLRQTGTALGAVETELRQLRLDTGDILSTISTGILTVDGGGRLAYINPAASELLALPASQWLGKPVLDLLDRAAPGLGRIIARSSRTRQSIRRFETDEAEGGQFVLGVSTTLMERPGLERPPVTAIFQDITEKMRVEALRRRAERLEAVAELSASLAHEIKNPLASIRSAVEQLAGEGVELDDRKLLERLVVRESDRLSRLLAEFIDFARVKITDPKPVDLRELVRNVVDLARAHPESAGRRLRLSMQGEGPLVVQGAEDLLHRAVFNLVLNAAQWAGEGGEVEVALEKVSSDILSPALGFADTMRVVVADSGPGVPPEIGEHIFDPFFTRRPGGTGLGLALVQRAVEAHGGAIFVDSARPPQSGAIFTLYLPALFAAEIATESPTTEPHLT